MRAGFIFDRKIGLNPRIREPVLKLFFKRRNKLMKLKLQSYYFKYTLGRNIYVTEKCRDM